MASPQTTGVRDATTISLFPSDRKWTAAASNRYFHPFKHGIDPKPRAPVVPIPGPGGPPYKLTPAPTFGRPFLSTTLTWTRLHFSGEPSRRTKERVSPNPSRNAEALS